MSVFGGPLTKEAGIFVVVVVVVAGAAGVVVGSCWE